VNDAPGNDEGPIADATGPRPLINCGRSYFAIVLRIALLRCMAQPALLLSPSNVLSMLLFLFLLRSPTPLPDSAEQLFADHPKVAE
jgi:hypothetical protein